MLVEWPAEALADLAAAADFAPRQALRVYAAIEALAEQPFPWMYRGVEGRADEHVLSVPPHAVFYTINGDRIRILAIADTRRRREPW